MRKDTVLKSINDIYAKHQDKSRDEKRLKLKEELVNQIVMTNYGKTQYYKIEDIVFEEMETITFKAGDEQQINMADYYLKKYQITIKNLKQPLIQV